MLRTLPSPGRRIVVICAALASPGPGGGLEVLVNSSAYWIAAARARESERPDRLFHDPYAAGLAGARGVAIMQASERASGGENPYLPVRTRWFDDVIGAALAVGVDQVVMLGAGLDTRP